ncbi:MAG: chromate transporter [Alphaproteobacteria bacterium]
MIYVLLYQAFFLAGLFAFGGGLAIIPFLNNMIDTYHWFTQEDLTTLIALAEMTPGAIGINMATYAGFLSGGCSGAVIATAGLVTPSVILVSLFSKIWEKIKDYPVILSVFSGIKMVVAGLITAIFLTLFISLIQWPLLSLKNTETIVIFIASFALTFFKKIPLFVLICFGAGLGILFGL